MYKIIGIDGKQYGPVSVEQIKLWISAGRADAQTKALADGATEWKPLSSFPEFAQALASKAVSPPPPLSVPPPLGPTKEAAPKSADGPTFSIDVGSCLGRAWDMLMTDLWPIIGVNALIWLALSATHAAYIGLLVTGPLLGGLSFYCLKKIRGQRAELPDAFAGFTTSFLQLMLVSVVAGLLTAVGLALCVIPGVYLAVAWSLAVPLVIDRQLGFWEAMELSRKTVYPRWWSMAWLLLVCALINLGGGLLCCVGILFTLPLTTLALTYAYEDVFRITPIQTA